MHLCIIQLLGQGIATPHLVPISIIFTRDWDIAYSVAIQWLNSWIIYTVDTKHTTFILYCIVECAVDQAAYTAQGLIGKLFSCNTNGNYLAGQTGTQTGTQPGTGIGAVTGTQTGSQTGTQTGTGAQTGTQTGNTKGLMIIYLNKISSYLVPFGSFI